MSAGLQQISDQAAVAAAKADQARRAAALLARNNAYSTAQGAGVDVTSQASLAVYQTALTAADQAYRAALLRAEQLAQQDRTIISNFLNGTDGASIWQVGYPGTPTPPVVV